MSIKLVNAGAYAPADLVTPPTYGYLQVSAAVAPPAGRAPFAPRSAERQNVTRRLAAAAGELAERPDVVRATAYRAVLVPPAPVGGPPPDRYPAPHDVVVLVETSGPETLTDVRFSAAFQRLTADLSAAARDVRVTESTCVKSIGDVDKTPSGLYLFNYFMSDDPAAALELWDHLAGWYTKETGLVNSTVLAPTGEADYAFVNHARWDIGLPRLMSRQFTTPTFRSYLLANLRANHTAVMPVLFHHA